MTSNRSPDEEAAWRNGYRTSAVEALGVSDATVADPVALAVELAAEVGVLTVLLGEWCDLTMDEGRTMAKLVDLLERSVRALDDLGSR